MNELTALITTPVPPSRCCKRKEITNILRSLRISFSGVVNGLYSVCALGTEIWTLNEEQNGPPPYALLASLSNNKSHNGRA
jgi:hypothetical protein